METCLTQSCATAISGSSSVVFAHLLRALLAAQCSLNADHEYPPDRTQDVLDRLPNGEFDFIVVGGGTSGSILARRLSEVSDWNILLIERGLNPSDVSEIPALLLTLQGTVEDYKYKVEPGNYCLGTANKQCIWAKGRALGGSTVINAMLHIHGNEKDYNAWSQMGNTGWDYESVLPYFRKSENYDPEIPQKFGSKYFGTGGPVPLRYFNYSDSIMQDIILDAVRETGVPVLDVFNGIENIGFGRAHGTVDNGRRQNIAKAYLNSVKDKSNLFVMKEARVDSLVMDGKRATGVKVTLNDGKTVEVGAKKEVILSAGSIATPQLLMLSGIGPKEELERHGIKMIAELPAGKNLQDHLVWLGVHLTYNNHTKAPGSPTAVIDAAYDFLMHRTGEFVSTGGIDLLGFINTKDKNSKFPDMEFHHVHLPRGETYKMAGLAKSFAYNEEVLNELFNINNEFDSIFMSPTLLNPKSVGEIKLRNTNPEDPPLIYSNYLTHKDDVNNLIDALDYVRSLVETESFKKYGLKLRRFNLAACKDFPDDSRDYWECNIRHLSASVFHPIGTAKMGPVGDPGAVVDPKLKVQGIHRLRVIDASIMPIIPSGNTNSAVMMIAEKGADMILQDWIRKDEL